jgi:hypothetical protein
MTNVLTAREAYLENRDRLLEYDNVLGVGFGQRESNGELTDEPAVIVFVEEKVPEDELREGQLLPRFVDDVRVDVRVPRLTDEEHREFLERNEIDYEDAECNLDRFFLDAGKIHEMVQRRNREDEEEPGPFDEPADLTTQVFDEIFVIEDDGSLVSGGAVDYVAAYDAFQAEFGDHYDFVFFHPDTASGIPNEGNYSPTVFNDISGINHYKGDSYDNRAAWGTSKLQSYQVVSGLTEIRRMLHETAHRWCAYAYHEEGGTMSENLHEDFSIPSQATFHWGSWFDNDVSCMDYDRFDWEDSTTSPGEYAQDDLDAGPPGVDEFGYHPLDRYLMGLMSDAEVGTFRYIQNPTDPDSDGNFSGTEVNLSATNVVNQEGARSPAYPNTQRVFHQAFVLITNDISNVGSLTDTSTVLGNLEQYRSGHLEAFREDTDSRAMIDGSLLHDGFESLYVRDNSADTGGTSSTGAFWNSPDVWVRNSADGGTTHQDTIRGQDNYVYARVYNDGSTDYEDVRVRVYRANFVGTEFYYPDDWHPDQLVGEAVLTVPAGGSEVAEIEWDESLIPDATWHPCLLVEVIPMEVTPETRHHVWDNRKLAQKNITIVDPPSDAVADVEFVFGNAGRVEDDRAVLTISRTVDIPGMDVYLDPRGVEVDPDVSGEGVPDNEYFALPTEPSTQLGADVTLGTPTRPDAPEPGASEGVSVTFPEETSVLVGCGGCESEDELVVTVCPDSKITVRSVDRSRFDRKARQTTWESRTVYRLPDAATASVGIPIGAVAPATMGLIVDVRDVEAGAGDGLLQVVQSDLAGTVVGGFDVVVRS